ncbi:hypothetical protein WN944_027154 [Citrus x changshan-huyou]|uniref:Uncharacterized protein n=1 Tax=Citrus x changshan-huyou TaxID=2935761 RepID=A0AAP0LH07_9ROSI
MINYLILTGRISLERCEEPELEKSGWKQHVGLLRSSKEIEKNEQDFLWNCALHFHKLNDNCGKTPSSVLL